MSHPAVSADHIDYFYSKIHNIVRVVGLSGSRQIVKKKNYNNKHVTAIMIPIM